MSQPEHARHTSGPWRFNDLFPSGPGFSITADGKRYHVCGCGAYQDSHPGASFTDEECRANARLIAAAPDLLEALKHAREWMDQDGCDCGNDEPNTCGLCVANAAIAKAEGR